MSLISVNLQKQEVELVIFKTNLKLEIIEFLHN